MMAESIILLVFFGYFLCVVTAYASVMHGPEKEEEEGDKKPDDKPKSEEKPEEKPEEAPEAGE